MYVPLCEAWPLPPSGCATLSSPEVSGSALLAASEVLWQLSGHRYGSCSVLLRPCRPGCAGSMPADWWWPGAGWPYGTPWPGTTLWWAAGCGTCSGGCSCNSADTLRLPQPVQSITEVLIDGEVLAESAYNLYDGQLLVRADGGRWPMCQDWTVPVSGVGAWSVAAVAGWPVPMAGRFAVAELAREFEAFCTGGDCRLPAYTTGVTRQGVTQAFPDINDLVKNGLVGLPAVDLFLRPPPPPRAKIWNPDDFDQTWRRPGGIG